MQPYLPEFIAMETESDMSAWLDHLKQAVLEVSVDVTVASSPGVTVDTEPITVTTHQQDHSFDTSVVPSCEWTDSCENNEESSEILESVEKQADDCLELNGMVH